MTFSDEDVFQLDVPVAHILAVAVLGGVNYLSEDLFDFDFGKSAVFLLAEVGMQGAAFHQLHDQVQRGSLVDGIVVLNYVGVRQLP
eukprot:CAMPEP_0201285774 /NCGR_PEP_ID=MMETSP1317-20130820/113799_1 /ASSEMBLY_ACC=CAM_ASM_000770 /TAXON_ID=187299 /ORGANISM="Undescribed Undescribed, Strain Undescribed" /LENGTH=85 /DNA_ID=CAMNT_0047611689 /DNA_START=625 /DNA_END=882 /DNA_ORIENTATION=+